MEGTMLWFNPNKWHGFIHTDDGERLRVDQEGAATGQLLRGSAAGARESTSTAPADRVEEARAVSVAIVPLIAPRRARLRGRP